MTYNVFGGTLNLTQPAVVVVVVAAVAALQVCRQAHAPKLVHGNNVSTKYQQAIENLHF